ncbi:uncharacterized protein LTR77_004530 [Saxophila tyrrhenica]|uniref:Uncharacterized protein n=1 Tax=Saxophila tyrrhenica TaxID=1690608 RepID=A0AAV9PD29_9PEZI|nr:hypothetical protein LTR77_004530 [Saxophila tyrrhenica]
MEEKHPGDNTRLTTVARQSYTSTTVYNTIFTTPGGYWKLPNYEHLSAKEMIQLLKDRNYYIGGQTNKPALLLHLDRTDRGLLSYVSIPSTILRGFMHSRGLSIPGGGKGYRHGLQQALVTADDNPTFDRFLDLPPELRMMIYTFHFADYPRPMHAPEQPPVTRVSSLIRKEALPIFYFTLPFQLNMLLAEPTTFFSGGGLRLKVPPRHTRLDRRHGGAEPRSHPVRPAQGICERCVDDGAGCVGAGGDGVVQAGCEGEDEG